MSFAYIWKKSEANFGKPLQRQIRGGTHISFEMILSWRGAYVALRRNCIPGHEAPPKKKSHPGRLLYFCHDLIRRGESVEQCIRRVVSYQTGVGVRSYKILDIDSTLQKKDGQWAFTPMALVMLTKKPRVGNFGNPLLEVVSFTKKNIPTDFAWWSKRDLAHFLKKFD